MSGDVELNPGPRQRRSPASFNSVRVLQMNINGWKSRRLCLEKALGEWKVDVALLQESNLQAKDHVKVKGYTVHRRDRQIHRGDGPSPHGGLLTLVREGTTHDLPVMDLPNLPPGAALEVMSVTLRPPRTAPLTLTNVYRPPGRAAQDDGRDTDLHLPCWPTTRDAFICGDMNAHGSWDRCKEGDAHGDAIEAWLDDNCWNHLNDGSHTRTAPDGTPSTPDASFAHASWATRVSWRTMPTLGSDHLPILIDIQAGPASRSNHRGPTKMSLKKANQLLFGTTADLHLGSWSADSFPSFLPGEGGGRLDHALRQGGADRPQGVTSEAKRLVVAPLQGSPG